MKFAPVVVYRQVRIAQMCVRCQAKRDVSFSLRREHYEQCLLVAEKLCSARRDGRGDEGEQTGRDFALAQMRHFLARLSRVSAALLNEHALPHTALSIPDQIRA
jgi:hypothetical protein